MDAGARPPASRNGGTSTLDVRGHQGGLGRAAIIAVYTAVFYVALPALLFGLGDRLDKLFSLPPLPGTQWGAVPTMLGGGLLVWATTRLVVTGDGLPIAHLPPARLVACGPYRLSRHPIYVGFTLAIAGLGILSGSAGRGLFAPALLAAGWLAYIVGIEEPRLVARHGEAYRAYVRSTPLLPIPFRRAFARAGRALWQRLRPSMERIANTPVLLCLGPCVGVTYGAFVAAGAAAMALGSSSLLLGASLPSRTVAAYLVSAALSMVAGGRVVSILYELPRLARSPGGALRRVGFVSWGGYAAVFAFPIVFARATGSDGLTLLDATFLPGLACSALGRIGCLTYGCCYGRPAAQGIRWTHSDAKVVRELGTAKGSVARVPTPLLSSLQALLILVLLVVLGRRGASPGATTALGVLAYGLLRFALESLRDEPRFGTLALTRGQVLSAIAALLGAAALFALPAVPAARPLRTAPLTPGAIAASAAATVVVLIACGLHWERVGFWGRKGE